METLGNQIARASQAKSGASNVVSPVSATAQNKPINVRVEASVSPSSVGNQASGGANIVIRTMQDDLSALANKPTFGRTASNLEKKSSEMPLNAKLGAGIPSMAPRTLPLPPINAAQQQKLIVPPRKKKHVSGVFKKVMVPLCLLLIVAGTGAAAWVFWGKDFFAAKGNQIGVTKAVPAMEILPADVAFILEYKLGSTEERTAVATAWNKRTGNPTLTSLLRGDPRMLLDAADITEFYFVVLPNEPRPFLIIPASASAKQLLIDHTEISSETVKGWVIAHSVSVTPYKEALVDKTISQLSKDSVVKTAFANQALVRIIAGPSLLKQLRSELLGNELAEGQIQELGLSGRLLSGNQAWELTGSGSVMNVTGSESASANQQILSMIPANSSFVLLGSNFQADLTSTASGATPLDLSVLDRANVQTLLAQLTTSYAFFTNNAQSGRSYGLIIELPATLQRNIVVGDAAIEEGLNSLVFLLTGRKSVAPVAFNSGSYNGLPLRYANLEGASTALDYAVTDTHVLVATSKDMMFDLLATYQGSKPSITGLGSLQQVLNAWGAIPSSQTIIMGKVALPGIRELLPVADGVDILFGESLQRTAGNTTVLQAQGVFKGAE